MLYERFSDENKNNIALSWNSLVKNGVVMEKDVRPLILESWLRSRDYGVNPYKIIDTSVLSAEELSLRKQRLTKLIAIARPYMENLFNFVKGSGFLVALTDQECYVLDALGDNDAMVDPAAFPGTNRSEKNAGTNAIGTCIYLNHPVQVWAAEHYYRGFQKWTCSAAPIHDSKGNIIGCLDISGHSANVHLHTLGMVVAAVDAIERELLLEDAFRENHLITSQLNATLQSISEGIIVIDLDGVVVHINSYALDLLGAGGSTNYIGRKLEDCLEGAVSLREILLSRKSITDKEIKFQTPGGMLHCTISINTFKNSSGAVDGLVIIIKEIRSVHNLVNKIIGNQAKYSFADIIGNTLNETMRLAKAASKSISSVLLLGESGTGKELFAQAIHNHSERNRRPFVAVNCGALPRGLIESELFGYEGGAFTGSRKDGHPGKFELADGGTILLDEIGDMPLDVQVTLLRVLQNKEITRVGGTTPKKINVRVIAATNIDLEEAIANRRFRSDLYYRLNVFRIYIPPLRERKPDIHLLFNYFIKKYSLHLGKTLSAIDEDVYRFLEEYEWPGNIRELENTAERLVNYIEGDCIRLSDLRQHLSAPLAKAPDFPQINQEGGRAEIEDLIAALEKYRGNIKKAADSLGIARQTAYRKLSKSGIDYSRYRQDSV